MSNQLFKCSSIGLAADVFKLVLGQFCICFQNLFSVLPILLVFLAAFNRASLLAILSSLKFFVWLFNIEMKSQSTIFLIESSGLQALVVAYIDDVGVASEYWIVYIAEVVWILLLILQ